MHQQLTQIFTVQRLEEVHTLLSINLTVLLLCPGILFNGWYADSEIVRNMTDEGRFNIMPEVADRLGYNLGDNASLWRDAALNVVNEVSICSAFVQHQDLGAPSSESETLLWTCFMTNFVQL